jgi:poly(ribitol-phosphate) beta-N-acetylglucosaminyltransferase
MPVDVSVIIPFHNTGANIDECLDSLLVQTLVRDRFEVVLVDDGSTDGSLARVRERVSEHPGLMSVHHIPASGGPGRPRNVGVDRAAGRFVQFLDSDDALAPSALQRMLEIADSSDADIVVSKISSDFRGVHHPLFRRTVTGRSITNYPLWLNLTVCKMFRRQFLVEHALRFPEGPHYVEDEHFCISAYARAGSVAVIGDLACYFYRRRRAAGRNFGDTPIMPADYFRELGTILDLVDAEIPDLPTRRAVQGRFYRVEMLGRLRGAAMASYDADYRRELIGEVQRLADARFGPDVHDALPAFIRTQSRLLPDLEPGRLVEFARALATIRLQATTTAPRWIDGRLVLGIDATWSAGDEPFRLERDGDHWSLPAWIAPGVGATDRRLSDIDEPDLDLAVVSQQDAQLWSTTEGLRFEVDRDDGPRVHGQVSLDPSTVMGGAALTAGTWNVRLRVIFAGITFVSPVRPRPDGEPVGTAWLTGTVEDPHSVATRWAGRSNALAVDVDEWSQSLHDLAADQVSELPQVDRRRRLVVKAGGLHGPSRGQRSATLVLEPLDGPAAGPVTCPADVVIGPDGSTIQATIPDLPAGSARWSLLLRIGPIGGAPARRLPVVLSQAGRRALRVSAPS